MWRRFLSLVGLLVSVWILMICASYGISILILNPLEILETVNAVAIGFYRVVIGGTIFLLWLWIWKSLTEKYFTFFSKRRRIDE